MGTFWKAALATTGYALLHSAVASSSAKRRAAAALGGRNRNGLYRVFYNAQALVSFGALAWYIRSLPDTHLYRVEGAPALLMRAGQGAGLLWAIWAAHTVGIPSITGLRSLAEWVGDGNVSPEPAAQGPAPSPDGGLDVDGPFRLSRHPLNFAPLPVFWLNPVMTTRRLAFTLVGSAYLVLGSAHEEKRLEAAYGAAYRRYRDSGVPFYLPRS